jgi:phage recombination protein Bet
MAEKNELSVIYEIDGNEIKLTMDIVQRFLTGNAVITLPEFKFFTELCKVRKLNPFLKEAYLVKFGNSPAQIVVGKDAILKRAIMNKNFNGRSQGIIVAKQDGTIENRVGTFKMPNELLVGGWAKVYRKDIEYPTEITVSFDEVAQHKGDGSLNSNWANKGATMVEKVALVRALRETFAEDFGGMIDEDEAWDSKNVGRENITPDLIQNEPDEMIVVDLNEKEN